MKENLIDTKAVSVLLGVKVSHIRNMVFKKQIPFIKIGHLVRFDPKEIELWIGAQKKCSQTKSPLEAL